MTEYFTNKMICLCGAHSRWKVSDVLNVAMVARRSGGGVSGDAGRSALSDAIALGLDSGSMFDYPSAHATSPSCSFAVDESAEGSSIEISSLSFKYAELANEVTVGGVSLKRFVARGATSRRSNSCVSACYCSFDCMTEYCTTFYIFFYWNSRPDRYRF